MEGLVGDIKVQVEQSGDELTAEKVNQLALDPALVEAVREKIETSLLRAYTKGRMQGRRAVGK